MDIKSMQEIVKSYNGKWYYNQKETAQLLGCTRQRAGIFLNEYSVPFHRIDGKSKSYFLPDILIAIEKTKWKDSTRSISHKNHA